MTLCDSFVYLHVAIYDITNLKEKKLTIQVRRNSNVDYYF